MYIPKCTFHTYLPYYMATSNCCLLHCLPQLTIHQAITKEKKKKKLAGQAQYLEYTYLSTGVPDRPSWIDQPRRPQVKIFLVAAKEGTGFAGIVLCLPI